MHFYNWKAWAILGSWQVLYPLLTAFKWYWFEEKQCQRAAFHIIAWKHKSIPFSQIFFFFATFANDHRYFWGFVLHSSTFLPALNLQRSQNVETLWHGDNFLSNSQCCQQRGVVILTVGSSLGLDLRGCRRLWTAVGSEVCVWVGVHLLSRCACFFSSCRHPFACYMMKKDLNRTEGFESRYWGQRIKMISLVFLIETSILKSWLDIQFSLFSCNQTRSGSPSITKFRLVCYVIFPHYFCCWLNSVAG